MHLDPKDLEDRTRVLNEELEDDVLDEEYANERVIVNPGPHVLLTVTTTGIGLDVAVKSPEQLRDRLARVLRLILEETRGRRT